MSKEIKIATPDETTVQKVESFLGCVNREVEKCMDNHRQNETRIENMRQVSAIIGCTPICILIIVAVGTRNIYLFLTPLPWLVILSAGTIVYLFCLARWDAWHSRKWEREAEFSQNRIAGEDIKKLLDGLAETHSLQYTWRGTQIDEKGNIVTDWDPPYEGTIFGKPEHLIQTIFCDGILFVSARYWHPIPIFPDDDITRNEKVVRISHQKDPYVELWDRCVPLRTIPIDPETDQLSVLQKDHHNDKFLPIEADEETMDYLVNRLSR